MRETTSFVLQVKRPSSLPKVRDQTDIVEKRRRANSEAIAFDWRKNSYSNTVARDTTTATPCAQNSATSQMDYAMRMAEEV